MAATPKGPLSPTGLTKKCKRCEATGAVAVDRGAPASEQPALCIDWLAEADPSVSAANGRSKVDVLGDVRVTLAELLDADAVCVDCAKGEPLVFPTMSGSEFDVSVHPHARLFEPLESAARLLRSNDNGDGWLAEKVAGKVAPVLRALLPICEPEYRKRFTQCVTDPKFDPAQLSD